MSGPVSQAAFRTGTGPVKVLKQRTWKPREVALVEHLVMQGATYAQIACRIGVSKSAIASLVNNRITPSAGNAARDQLIWRAKQLVTAGYTAGEVADKFGFTPEIAEAAFVQAYPEVAA